METSSHRHRNDQHIRGHYFDRRTPNEIQANIEESVYTLLCDLITENNLAFEIQKSKITHRLTGSTFKFKGFREQGSVSIKGVEGCDILWIDEAQSITKNTLDIIIPTVIRKQSAKLFFTMNRFLMDDAVPELLVGDPECLHIQINYFENPYCSLAIKNAAENMRIKRPKEYNHIYLGQPLASASDYLFNHQKLREAFDIKPFGDLIFKQRVLGIDFAAQGDDQCVAVVLDRLSNQHWGVTERIPWDEPDTMISVGKIVNLIGIHKPDVTVLDIGGMGKPVYDRLVEVGMKIQAYDGGSTDGVDTNHYANIRAESYFGLREWFDGGFLCLDRVKDAEIVKQLDKIKMKYRSNGVKLIEAKLDMKKDLGYSPDDADALNMAAWGARMFLGKQANSNSDTGTPRRKSGRIKR
jgi:phage terminase large subunit